MGKQDTRKGVREAKDMHQLDFFAKTFPSFNDRGKNAVSSYAGNIATLVVVTILFLYGSAKFNRLINRLNPNIVMIERTDAYTPDDSFLLNEIDRKLAIGIVSEIDNSNLIDARYNKLVASWVYSSKE